MKKVIKNSEMGVEKSVNNAIESPKKEVGSTVNNQFEETASSVENTQKQLANEVEIKKYDSQTINPKNAEKSANKKLKFPKISDLLEPTIVIGDERRRPAFTHINRFINHARAMKIKGILDVSGYLKERPVDIIKAEDSKCENLNIRDIYGKVIDKKYIRNYAVIVDGQHRTLAVAFFNYNNDLEKEISLPANEIKLGVDETYSQRLLTLNLMNDPWKIGDYVDATALMYEGHKLLTIYSEKIKRKKNSYAISTLNLIYTGKGNTITKQKFEEFCTLKASLDKQGLPIIPGANIENGDEFINTCLKIGFEEHHVNKRYIINEFLNLKNEYNTHNNAIKVLKRLTKDDVGQVLKPTGTIDEELLKQKFIEIRNRPDTQEEK